MRLRSCFYLAVGLACLAIGDATAQAAKPVYLYVDHEPQLPGKPGYAAIQAAAQALVVVPMQVAQESLNGLVFTRVVIAPDGSVAKVRIERHQMATCVACDSAAVQAVRKLPRLTPPQHEGQAVYFSFPLRIAFPGPPPGK